MALLKDSTVAGNLRVTDKVLASEVETDSLVAPSATQSVNGLMSSTDKTKLDGIDGINVYYIEGPDTDTTAGTWTGTLTGLIEYYDGLTILYVPAVAGSSDGTTLNLNDLGAVECYTTNATALSTHYSVGTPILFTYRDNGWRRADYNSNTTYSTLTAAQITTGTATSARVTTAANVKNGVTGAFSAGANVGGVKLWTKEVNVLPDVAASDDAKFLQVSDGAWGLSSAALSNATTSAAGLMSSTDKTKLDGVATGATANVGTVTGVKMNNGSAVSPDASGVVDLGTVITSNPNYIPSTASEGGTAGLVPAPPNYDACLTSRHRWIQIFGSQTITLSAGSWSSATPPTQTVAAMLVTANSDVIVGPDSSITNEQLEALSQGKIVCTAQAAQSLTFTCYGTEPTVNIPITYMSFQM